MRILLDCRHPLCLGRGWPTLFRLSDAQCVINDAQHFNNFEGFVVLCKKVTMWNWEMIISSIFTFEAHCASLCIINDAPCVIVAILLSNCKNFHY